MTTFRIVYHDGTRTDLRRTDEETAVRWAQSESGILNSLVSLWAGANLVAAFERGEERDLTPTEVEASK